MGNINDMTGRGEQLAFAMALDHVLQLVARGRGVRPSALGGEEECEVTEVLAAGIRFLAGQGPLDWDGLSTVADAELANVERYRADGRT